MPAHAMSWKPDAFAGVTLAASLLLYLIGFMRMPGRLRRLEVIAFAVGWSTLAVALLSPIATMSEWLFSVHMTQHELLMLVAAPLLAIGRPLVPMLWAVPSRWRAAWASSSAGDALRVASAPLFAFAIHAAALWIWHVP